MNILITGASKGIGKSTVEKFLMHGHEVIGLDIVPSEINLPKAETKKHVVILGGGPAGMKAAITASDRGHKVTIIEKQKELGGMLRFISKEAILNIRRYFLDHVLHKI